MNQVNDKHARGDRADRMCLLCAAALHGSTKAVPAQRRNGREPGAGQMTRSDLEPGRRCGRITESGRLAVVPAARRSSGFAATRGQLAWIGTSE
jgi:hypothetical protein